jgi:hypothetical protein
MWHFFDEGSNQGESLDRLRAACGFCAEHVEMFRRVEMDGINSTLAMSTTFADTFEGIVEDLDTRNPDASSQRNECPACANRKEHVCKHDHEFRHEPKGAERDSWRRAIFLTTGRPPPVESAAEPERGR